MTTALDQKIEAAYDWLANAIRKVQDWHVLLFVMVNAIVVSLMTTGYLGEESIKLASPAGGWYLWSFLVMMLCVSVVVRPNSIFLNKVFTAGAFSFFITWNLLALTDAKDAFEPFADHWAAQLIIYVCFAFAMKWCFTGNHDIRQQVAISQSDYEEFMRLKQAQSNVIPMDQAGEG